MDLSKISPQEWSVIVALSAVTVIPLVRAAWKKLVSYYDAAQDAAMAARLKEYVTRQELEVQFDTLTELQARQHAENQRYLSENHKFLDMIRTEALKREEKLTTLIQLTGDQNAKQNDRIGAEVHHVNQRVDSVLQMLGDRRQRPRG